MNKFGRSNNDSTEYDSDASGSESDGAVPTSGDIHNDAPDEQQPDEDAPDGQQPHEVAASADEIARRITGLSSSNWGSYSEGTGGLLSPILAFSMALLFMKHTGLVDSAYELMSPDSLLNLVNDVKAVIHAEASLCCSSCVPAILKSGTQPASLRATLFLNGKVRFNCCRYLCNQCYFAASFLMEITLSPEMYFSINNYLKAGTRSGEPVDPRVRRSLGLPQHVLPSNMQYFDPQTRRGKPAHGMLRQALGLTERLPRMPNGPLRR